MDLVTEGSATIRVPMDQTISRSLEVFYNPLMALNRDFSIIVLKALGKQEMVLLDLLAGSGVRTIRLLKELPFQSIGQILVNDVAQDFATHFTENLLLSGLEQDSRVVVSSLDANLLLASSKAFDYIDIDPFGSPNPFLDQSIRHLARGGILAVTATDTAPLCGTYPDACRRKYFATPLRNHLMHEIGLRILIRKVQLIGAQYDLALVPVLTMRLDHYFRAFFVMSKGKKKCDEILAQHGLFEGAGPLWLGNLWDGEMLDKMYSHAQDYPLALRYIERFKEEASVPFVGYSDVHQLSRALKLVGPPKNDEIISALRQRGFAACSTHFLGQGIRTNADESTLKEVMKTL